MKKLLSIVSILCCFLTVKAAESPVHTELNYVAGSTGAFCRVSFTQDISQGILFNTGGICWSTQPNPTLNDNNAVSQSRVGQSLLCRMNDLTPSTEYYVRGYIRTKKDSIFYGNEIRVYTIPAGNLSYTLTSATQNADISVKTRISDAAVQVCELYKNWTSISKHFSANYNAGTQTADAVYGGWINIGANASYQRTGTLLHELNHVMGGGQCSMWYTLMVNNVWQGSRANEVLRIISGNQTVYMRGDNMHFWPSENCGYNVGINGAHEDSGAEMLYILNCLIAQAYTEDGLPYNSNITMPIPSHLFKAEANKKYYIKPNDSVCGRYTSYLRENNGILELYQANATTAIADDNAAWYLEYDPQKQRYNIQNASSGNFISTNKNNNSILVSVTDNLQDNAFLFQMVRPLNGNITEGSGENQITTEPYLIVGNPSTNSALDIGKIRKTLVLSTYQRESTSQQWILLTEEEALLFDKANQLTDLPRNNADIDIKICIAENSLQLSNIPSQTKVKCFDILGKCHYNAHNIESKTEIALQQGIYILQIDTPNNQLKQKIIIK